MQTHWAFETLNVLADICFVIDIIVSFRTTRTIFGQECVDPNKIAIEYLKTQFTLDFLSAFPFEVFTFFGGMVSKQRLKLISFLKLVRLLRINRIIVFLRINKELKAVSNPHPKTSCLYSSLS